MFEIEKGVPIPTAVLKQYESKYPWYKMEVGNSFFVPDGDLNKCRAAARPKVNRTGRFKAVRVDGGVRVWRVE